MEDFSVDDLISMSAIDIIQLRDLAEDTNMWSDLQKKIGLLSNFLGEKTMAELRKEKHRKRSKSIYKTNDHLTLGAAVVTPKALMGNKSNSHW